MTMLKHIRRLACVAAVAIAVLTLAAPAQANLTVTLTDAGDSATGLASVVFTDTGTLVSGGFGETWSAGTVSVNPFAPYTTTYTGVTGTYTPLIGSPVVNAYLTISVSPGAISLTGTFGNMTLTTFSVNSNYSGSTTSPAPGTIPAYATDATLTASAKVADSLQILVGSSTFFVPNSPSLYMTSSESSTQMSAGTTSVFGSSVTTSGVGGVTRNSSNETLTGAITTQTGLTSPTVTGISNPNASFSISNTLTLSYANVGSSYPRAGESINVNGSTDVYGVPEPSTFGVAVSGGLLMVGLGWVRRRRRDRE